jgi:hypothetical protein
MPSALADLLGISADVQVPLFVVIFLGVGAGLLIGFLWEWVREHRIRSGARAHAREAAQLRQEVDRLKKTDQKDDVIALLEGR